ncbi:MAG: YitT family protein [Clostridia bacterium]|nr:YitT family protein [Clostridia bacterium]
MTRSKKETVKRYAALLIGLYFMALSVRLSVATGLGTSPISTLPNVFAYIFPDISFGVIMFIWNMVLLVAQIIILRKDFKPVQLLQIPLSFVFSAMLDFNQYLLSFITTESIVIKIIMLVAGCILLGFSVFITVRANVIMNSGEGIVKAIADKTHFEFGYVKVALDVSYVVIGAVISFAVSGRLNGIGLGTVFLAVCTGFAVKFFTKLLGAKVDAFLSE